MKKTGLTFLALSIAILSLAQVSGNEDNQSISSGDLENQFYFRFGYSHPANSYLGVEDMEFWDDFSRLGGTFELGSIFFFNSLDMADGLRLGLNLDYVEISYNQLELTDPDVDFALGLLKVASKIGPTLSYSPASKLVFDLFVKAKIPWVAGLAIVSDESDEGFFATPGFGLATGINLRYRFLMIGFEYNTDNMKFENVDDPGEYFGNFSDDSDKTPMPGFSFSFGFTF
jgi:hypothetical protein